MAAGNAGILTVTSMQICRWLKLEDPTAQVCMEVTSSDNGDGTFNISVTYQGSDMPAVADMDNPPNCVVNNKTQQAVIGEVSVES